VTKTPKQRTPKPKPVKEAPAQDEDTRMSATAEDSQQGKITDNTPRKRVGTSVNFFYESILKLCVLLVCSTNITTP
jgi:hypothetical protein